jgi:secondary thiamine-phosphate synthase enzyme
MVAALEGVRGEAARRLLMDSVVLNVETRGRMVIDLTDQVARFCAPHRDGLVHVFAPHATAGLALMEVGSGSEADLADALERLLPRDQRYQHRHGAAGHGADHLLPALVSPSVTIPVLDGVLKVGTWQSVVLVDTNGDNPHRQVRLSFLEG